MQNITKRDGTVVSFDRNKIINALKKAFKACEYTIEDKVIKEITDSINIWDDISVEDIQDQIEELLMDFDYPQVAKEYILYRKDRELIRKKNNYLIKKISEKLEASNIENQNANIDESSFGGRMGEANRVVTKDYALNYCMSTMAKENHLNNEIYIHDLDSYAVGMHNCASRDTKFCTNNGVHSFKDYSDGDSIIVLTHKGNFQQAVVKKFGFQKLNKITFSFAGQRFITERFTSNHRWILADETVTENLKIGDKLYKAPVSLRNFNWDTASDKEKYYWCLGFVLADGTEANRWSHGVKDENIKFVRLRLCGNKIQYEPRFSNLKHSTKELDNGDLYLTFSSIIGFRKLFPELNIMSRSEKLALFDGLYCANGQHSGSRKSIMTTNKQIARFIEDEVPALGYFILNITDKTGQKTNYSTRGFTKEYTFIGDSNKYFWTVADIQEDVEEEVWCLEVNEDHSFVLPNGITTGNCLSIPIDNLLKNGFTTRQADIRPAGSVDTAFQLLAVVMQLQSLCQFGGVSYTHLDWSLVPYVRKSFYKHFKDGINWVLHENVDFNLENPEKISITDDIYKKYASAYSYAMAMLIREIQQGAEALYHNLGTLQSRSGDQLPFSSINYGTCTLIEGQLICEALIKASKEGIGKFHKTPIFPCAIFQLGKGINRKPGDPNYYLYRMALESTAQRLYPNYANIDWSGNEGYDKNDPRTYFSTMGCRTSSGYDVNGFGQLKDGRGNICPVTIIMPTLAMQTKDPDKFMELLDKKIHEAKDMLIERFNWICSQSPNSAKFMYDNHTMAGYVPEEGIISALKHGTLSIGQIGLAETLQILIGCNHTIEKGMELAKKIESLFAKRCKEFKETYKLNFGVYYTPAENLCYTAMKKFKEKYGIIPNVSDREFFTNSMHVPVWENVSVKQKIDIESQLTGYSSAGCITYIELPETAKNNIDALEEIVNYAMDKDIPYFAINLPNDTCDDCGYQDEIGDTCPQCGSTNIKRLRRVTGL